MKNKIILGLLAVITMISCTTQTVSPGRMNEIETFAKKIEWTGQGSIHLKSESVNLWMDPYRFRNPPMESADYILITHSHSDHFNKRCIGKIFESGKTKIIAPQDVIDKLDEEYQSSCILAEPDMVFTYDNVIITAVPSYTIKKGSHKKEKNWLGYIVEIGGIKTYYVGDSEFIPEMKGLVCDIILTPLGYTYTMGGVNEAVSAVKATTAIVAIPVHFGIFEGSVQNADEFITKIDEIKNITPVRLEMK